ncbi:MAG: hypothetical protein AAF682_31550 [Planctomycetota bacterium]
MEPQCRQSLRFRRTAERAWVRFERAAVEAVVRVNGVEVGRSRGAWSPFEVEATPYLRDDNEVQVEARWVDHPTNGFLPRIGVRWSAVRGLRVLDRPTPAPAPRPSRARVDGDRLLVDGRPTRVRGVLHWGYYPELADPWPDEAAMRRELELLRARGFNLVKLCLWVPPPRFYELCDELGMLVWQEYPVWDAPLAGDELAEELERLIALDAAYPCVVLRSLTCENDRVDAALVRRVARFCRDRVRGALVLGNSGWLCSAGEGDFHDEHAYLHNLQWLYYPQRIAPRLTRPLILGETMCFDRPADVASAAAACRRWQIETLARELPHAGYVITALRDIPGAPLGLLTERGDEKDRPEDWDWHREPAHAPRPIAPPSAPWIGPRKGEWKCREHTFWSPVVRVLVADLPRELIEREALFELFTGRVLTHAEGTRVLVELLDYHDQPDGPVRHPLVIELESQGERRVVSAFRTDTPAGRELAAALAERRGPAPEVGPLAGDAVVLERWTMTPAGGRPREVRCDTPFVNGGANVFEGEATFEARFHHPGGRTVLVCEGVGDFFELHLDDLWIAEAGPRTGTWDGTRDRPRQYGLQLDPGEHALRLRVRDWRGAGGLVGPVYFTSDPDQRVF